LSHLQQMGHIWPFLDENQIESYKLDILTNRMVTKPHVFSSDETYRLSINARPKPQSSNGGGNLVCNIEEKMLKAV